jgi:hypothetical protein
MKPAKKQFVGLAFAMVLLIAVITSVHVWRQNHSPEHTMQVIDHINTVQEIEAATDYLTPTGKRILLSAAQRAKSKKPSTTKILSKQIGTDKCSFQVSNIDSDGSTVIADCVLVKQGPYWKFDDIWVESIAGRQADMMISFMIDHPYQAALTMVWQNPEVGVQYAQKLVTYFVAGFKIGQTIGAIAACF